MITKKTITEFLSDEYKEFAMYTIENRAIPSVIDGLKVSTRKVIHTSSQIWKTGSEKSLKVFQLSFLIYTLKNNTKMKHLKTPQELNEASENLNISDVRRSFSFTYEDLFKAFVAGDTESMRTGNAVDREEFEESEN